MHLHRMLLMVLALLPLGCSGGTSRYIPAEANARSALQTALDAWKAGKPYGAITDATPSINVFEARWRDGKKLDEFEILEEVPDGEHKQFKVRLKLNKQPEETTVYLVVGIDPLNVFREADYQRAAAM